MRIDAHQHFWKYNEQDYDWMSDRHKAIQVDYMPEQLKPLLEKAGFDGSIAVQARQSLQETEWLLDLAVQHPEIKGVIGWVDLCSPEIGIQLEKVGNHPLLKGVRHVVHDEPDERFILRDSFMNGIAALEQYGLTYDLLLFPKHLPYAARLAEKFPNQPFVLDHLAKPDIANGRFHPWEQDLAALAAYSNVYCKLSGMVTEANWGNWKQEDFTAYLDTVFRCFGTDRLMIGSDWPVCTLSGSYEQTINIVKSYLQQFDKEEQALVLGENCARLYGIRE
ncbi:amidohydrolase family protein [Paenibacillus glycanilyticus]|uniref:Amidohydrolase n=1 Tax=Paenibacillus glycanilyticus TaxID=126569 RepID=A0ABQ6GLW9_9BACL|nr:amidohydrolase family protein [Paenibacillus glycanilyticus]GLX71258.1 amidohydrolase [Paenibacillus glycanilyticus]